MAWIIPAGAGWSANDIPSAESLIESYSLHPAQFSQAYGSLEGYLQAYGWSWDGNGPVPGARQYADPSIPELIPGTDTAGNPTMLWNPEYEAAIAVTQMVDRGITDPVEQQAALDAQTQHFYDKAKSLEEFNGSGQWFTDFVSTALPIAIAAMGGAAFAPFGAGAAGAAGGALSGMNASGVAGGSLGDVLKGGAMGGATGAITGYAADGLSSYFTSDTGLGGAYATEGGAVDMGTGFGEGGDLWSQIEKINLGPGGYSNLDAAEGLFRAPIESLETDEGITRAMQQGIDEGVAARALSGFDMVGDMGAEAYNEMMNRVSGPDFNWGSLTEYAPDILKILMGFMNKGQSTPTEQQQPQHALLPEGFRTPTDNYDDALFGSRKKFGGSGLTVDAGSGLNTFNVGNSALWIP